MACLATTEKFPFRRDHISNSYLHIYTISTGDEGFYILLIALVKPLLSMSANFSYHFNEEGLIIVELGDIFSRETIFFTGSSVFFPFTVIGIAGVS